MISHACWLPSILNWMKAAAWPSIGCDTLRSTLYNCIAPTTLEKRFKIFDISAYDCLVGERFNRINSTNLFCWADIPMRRSQFWAASVL